MTRFTISPLLSAIAEFSAMTLIPLILEMFRFVYLPAWSRVTLLLLLLSSNLVFLLNGGTESIIKNMKRRSREEKTSDALFEEKKVALGWFRFTVGCFRCLFLLFLCSFFLSLRKDKLAGKLLNLY